MTHDEFESRWSQFIGEFNNNFDSPEIMEQLKTVAVQNTEKQEDLAINYEHIYQQQRMNNLVKDAIETFLDFDEK